MIRIERTLLLVPQGQTFRWFDSNNPTPCDRIDLRAFSALHVGHVLSLIQLITTLEFQLWMKMLPPSQYAGCVDKSFFYPANYMKRKHCNNSCDPKWAKAKD